jgi:hypothetical protein
LTKSLSALQNELCVQRTLPFENLHCFWLLPFALKNQIFAFGFAFCNILKIYPNILMYNKIKEKKWIHCGSRLLVGCSRV